MSLTNHTNGRVSVLWTGRKFTPLLTLECTHILLHVVLLLFGFVLFECFYVVRQMMLRDLSAEIIGSVIFSAQYRRAVAMMLVMKSFSCFTCWMCLWQQTRVMCFLRVHQWPTFLHRSPHRFKFHLNRSATSALYTVYVDRFAPWPLTLDDLELP